MCHRKTITIQLHFFVASLMLLLATGLAHAEPVMAIQDSTFQADYDVGNPGNELRAIYLVSNNSEPLGENNMIDLTLPAGSNQGVYDAVVPANWTFTINEDSTFFQGINNDGIIAPGSQGLFELYSTDLNIHQNFATATFRGPPIGLTCDPVLVDVPGDYPHTLSADFDNSGIVDFNDFAVLASQWQQTEPNIVGTSVTSYADTQNGITVSSNTHYSESQGVQIFNYAIQNNSGDTLFQISVQAEDWVGGYGLNQSWSVLVTDSNELNQDVICFDDNLLETNEEFIAGSNVLDTWGISQMELKGISGENYYLDVLAPLVPVDLEADIVDDDVIDIADLNALCSQWLDTEAWYVP